jgi:hypothetical protein
MGDRSADRAPVADLRVTDPAARIVEERVAGDDLAVVDLAVRGPTADPELVVGLDDPVEAGQGPDVDEQPGLREAQLDERDEAVAARQHLGLSLAILEDLQRFVQAPRPDVVELGGDHRAAYLLPAGAGTGRPVRPGRAQGLWRRLRPSPTALCSSVVTVGLRWGVECCGRVSARVVAASTRVDARRVTLNTPVRRGAPRGALGVDTCRRRRRFRQGPRGGHETQRRAARVRGQPFVNVAIRPRSAAATRISRRRAARPSRATS